MPEVTAERVRELLAYDPETGVFTWRVRRGRSAPAGSIAGWRDRGDYVLICVEQCAYFAHRLAWLYVNGQWPVGDIDHMNGIPFDNRIENLRDVNRSLNMQNLRRANRNNKLQLLGVTKSGKGFAAQIVVGGRALYLGTFPTAQFAHECYLIAKRKLHPGGTL